MDANQRSEFNNQTNNGANEKGTPGAQGASADHGQPLDHTYPQAAGVRQQGNQQRDVMGGTPSDAAIPGGSMENQINGGSGTVQGVTDSHDRQMRQKSGAYGKLEQPVGHRQQDGGANVSRQGSTMGGGMPGPQGASQGNASGSMGSRPGGNQQSSGGGMPGPGAHSGTSAGNLGGQEAQRGNTQLEVAGSRSMANQNSDVNGVHASNDLAGGLPRSPGGVGADSTSRSGSQTGPGGAEAGPAVHKSNDAAGGYPRSPGYANKLAGDQNMDDDTGFKRK